jgi:hypothetical protein
VSRRPASQIQDQLPEAGVPVEAAAAVRLTFDEVTFAVDRHVDDGYRLTLLSAHASCVRLDRGSI